jgi:hypothetical protein
MTPFRHRSFTLDAFEFLSVTRNLLLACFLFSTSPLQLLFDHFLGGSFVLSSLDLSCSFFL